MSNNVDDVKSHIERMRKLGELPYVAKYWSIIEMKESPKENLCHSSFYNGYIFPDLPVKPISTPFDFDADND